MAGQRPTWVGAARKMLLAYLESANTLANHPRWYNALTSDCTTNIRTDVEAAGTSVPWDWRILVNGRLDEMLFERGSIGRGVPFAELERRSHVNEPAHAVGNGPSFSTRIRAGLPGM